MMKIWQISSKYSKNTANFIKRLQKNKKFYQMIVKKWHISAKGREKTANFSQRSRKKWQTLPKNHEEDRELEC